MSPRDSSLPIALHNADGPPHLCGRYMIHKVTGLFALGSFAYRYLYRWPISGSLGFRGSLFDWFTMLMHVTLSASSIQFKVPSLRQPRRPTMIWHEARFMLPPNTGVPSRPLLLLHLGPLLSCCLPDRVLLARGSTGFTPSSLRRAASSCTPWASTRRTQARAFATAQPWPCTLLSTASPPSTARRARPPSAAATNQSTPSSSTCAAHTPPTR